MLRNTIVIFHGTREIEVFDLTDLFTPYFLSLAIFSHFLKFLKFQFFSLIISLHFQKFSTILLNINSTIFPKLLN